MFTILSVRILHQHPDIRAIATCWYAADVSLKAPERVEVPVPLGVVVTEAVAAHFTEWDS